MTTEEREYIYEEAFVAEGERHTLKIFQKVVFSLLEKAPVKCYFKSDRPGIFDPVDSDRDINMRISYDVSLDGGKREFYWDTASFRPLKIQESYDLSSLAKEQEEWLMSNKDMCLQKYVREIFG